MISEKKKKKKKKKDPHIECYQDQTGIVQIERNETRKQRQLSSAGPIQFYSTYLSSSRQKPHPAWALGGPRTWSRQPNHRRWPPWPSRRQKAPQHHTTPTFSKVGQHSCLFISVENAFRVHKALTQSLFAQFAATAPISVLQTPTKTPRGPSTKDSDATGLIKRPEINTKTSARAWTSPGTSASITPAERRQTEVWRTAACANTEAEHKLTKYSSKSAKFKTMKKMATSDVGHEPRPYRVHVFPVLVARRHGNRGFADFKVRCTWPWLLCEEWKTHDSTWAIPQSSRAHEQFVKTHEHFSKLMSNRWKAMSKIPRENCSWGFQNPHEPSWGLMRTHEFLMRTHEFLMRSSWGKNSSRLFFVRGDLHGHRRHFGVFSAAVNKPDPSSSSMWYVSRRRRQTQSSSLVHDAKYFLLSSKETEKKGITLCILFNLKHVEQTTCWARSAAAVLCKVCNSQAHLRSQFSFPPFINDNQIMRFTSLWWKERLV